MKKILTLVLSMMMALSLAACQNTDQPSESGFSGGTFEGTAKGFGGDVVANVKLSADKVIEAIEITADGETETIGGAAVGVLTDKMLEVQSTQVDTVAGATITSNAVIAAVNAALEAAGIDPATLTPKEVDKTVENVVETTDVVVVGAGGAGMTAAITLAEEGYEVILVEKAAAVGGNTSRATGGMNAAETHYQAEQNIEDSVEVMIEDTMTGGHNINNRDLVTVLAQNSAAGIDWLDSIGANLVSIKFAGGATNMRSHRPVDENGKVIAVGTYLVEKLKAAVDSYKNIEVIYNTEVTEIMMINGIATGVKAVSEAAEYTIHSATVIVTTGGYGGNMDIITQYRPDLEGYVSTNAPTIEGDAIAFLSAAGANMIDMEQIQIHPTVIQTDGYLISESLRGDGAILVNAEGKRFINELLTRDVVSAGVIEQPGSYAWLIVDQEMYDASKVVQGYVSNGYMIKGETLEALASAMDVDVNNLTATLTNWPSYVANGTDPDFGREGLAETNYDLKEGPWYAAKIAPGIHHCMGGVEINTSAQVISTEGSVIPGLYAAGEVTGGVHGGNRLGGNAVTDIIVFGRIAGASASDYMSSAK
ncbi:MAG: flavocytochrome c [Erysipelotrichaceae bacterium]|nr:flavocytochrome c [Erysipelotrichaceae bacterium]